MRLEFLRNKKNLLAFSGGIDSTALFFMLLERGIEFDIAIVDYCKRIESKLEVNYAKDLAEKYKKRCFVKEILLDDSNFEAKARDVRYAFFEEIIKGHNYDTLLLAHQLNDKLEWFLMQFTKGAGLIELYGMNEIEKRDGYEIIRPLLWYSKSELIEYLQNRGIKYFIDSSNSNIKYKRNYFRHNFSNRLIAEFKDGIKRSFEYLKIDQEIILSLANNKQIGELFIIKRSGIDRIDILMIDKALKKLGIIISKAQKDEILRQKDCVVSGKIAISFCKDLIYIAPFITTKMPKEFKEKMRLAKIPPKIRGYLFKNSHFLQNLGL